MKNSLLVFVASLIAVTTVTTTQAEEDHMGIINFNVGSSPVGSELPQSVTLYGCNNMQFSTQVSWDGQNQVVRDVPRGFALSESGQEYFIGKYYIASPPAFRSPTNKKDPYIGLVTPDRFTFQGDLPAQIVNLDYNILQATYLKDVPVDFNYSEGGVPSCNTQNVTAIPINTECEDFPWKAGAKGASGIGQLNNNGGTAFLPFLDKGKNPLQCNVTLLDDVVLNHEVYFSSGQGLTKTINLTAFHNKSKTMKLVCVPREPDDIPVGCSVPESATMYLSE